MGKLEDIQTLRRLLKEYRLPVSPILEYAIKNIEDEAGLADATHTPDDSDVISVQRKASREIAPEVDKSVSDNNDEQSAAIEYEGILMTKVADKSFMERGMTIPSVYHHAFYRACGKILTPGQSIKVWLVYDNETYGVSLINVSFSSERSETLQLLWRGNPKISEALQKNYPELYKQLSEKNHDFKEIKFDVCNTTTPRTFILRERID